MKQRAETFKTKAESLKRAFQYPSTPFFWNHINLLSLILFPLAALYDFVVNVRYRYSHTHRVKIPVVCVGNCTLGGAGKTPTVHALADYLVIKGLKVGIISRGYGGTERGPLKVDPMKHTAQQVGDEPLQLSRYHDVWVGRNRVHCAHQVVQAGKDIILMDDGLQNPSLHKDLSLLVVDGGYGIGNGLSFPSGPLREPLRDALRRVNGVLIIGEDKQNLGIKLQGKALLNAVIEPQQETLPPAGSPCVAFAGIGRPEKFFSMLAGLGYNVLRKQAFPDHLPYKEDDLLELWDYASHQSAYLLTTEKDLQRIPASLKDGVTAVRIRLLIQETAILDTLFAGLNLSPNPFKGSDV